MELGIETKIEGEIAERGVIALDAKIFSEIVRKLPDSDAVSYTHLYVYKRQPSGSIKI